MTNTSFYQTWQRMLGAINAQTDSALAKFLAITPAGVSSVKKKQKIPESWFEKICRETGVSRAWLVGSEPVQQADDPLPSPPSRTSGGRAARIPRHPAPKPRSFDVAAIISQAIEILESQTEYAESLENIINALHRAMLTEKQMDSLSSEMLETFAAFQKRQAKGERVG
ncbi:helix-turn-helix domain-containing protein [Desulfoplanes formicivorans]|uniref:Bacteriophage CI repressor N-terminal domain-containing protein n=1 Tax=Desulfoplanes formicivorans TaxID=1592317 RepID=A0A194AJ19_9BACT|nr:helix-turn-helix domain-containing protein [Desulfoplanes formicivorans]GAU09230.1 hypothetical protein DPF_1952 [Desulfoplanes formicivorans]